MLNLTRIVQLVDDALYFYFNAGHTLLTWKKDHQQYCEAIHHREDE